ncbi:MAG: hypothetical protein A2086_17290 [Spirochaetes bacterium GWD1_27_9]|nr:MAG: hypothetical protein A2Z98_12455 [Spirochaetes bacterium GWB1_27_13]OHD42475.1 MAG: hypothetical protein A2086_17290 [Spirochaetes bacterium GWD1_27_9]
MTQIEKIKKECLLIIGEEHAVFFCLIDFFLDKLLMNHDEDFLIAEIKKNNCKNFCDIKKVLERICFLDKKKDNSSLLDENINVDEVFKKINEIEFDSSKNEQLKKSDDSCHITEEKQNDNIETKWKEIYKSIGLKGNFSPLSAEPTPELINKISLNKDKIKTSFDLLILSLGGEIKEKKTEQPTHVYIPKFNKEKKEIKQKVDENIFYAKTSLFE